MIWETLALKSINSRTFTRRVNCINIIKIRKVIVNVNKRKKICLNDLTKFEAIKIFERILENRIIGIIIR